MISEGLITMFTGFVKFVLGMFPNDDPPSWMSGMAANLSTVLEGAAGLGAWVPWTFVLQVLGAVGFAMTLGFTIKLLRIVASFFTAGGGSAA